MNRVKGKNIRHVSIPFHSHHHSGVNLTADGDKGQLDAYVQSAEWDLEGKLIRSN